jgi:hypothetical protein
MFKQGQYLACGSILCTNVIFLYPLGLVLKDLGILTILERIIPSRTHLGTIEEDPKLMQSLYWCWLAIEKMLGYQLGY